MSTAGGKLHLRQRKMRKNVFEKEFIDQTQI
jgi:hypothetical protein